jgi:hypothetical protein
MPQHRIRRAVAACSILGLLTVATNGGVAAADLDGRGKAPRADLLEQDGGEFIPPHRGCRLIPQPQLNMWGEAAFYRPSWVCMSRGLYADTLPPPPPPRMFFGLW